MQTFSARLLICLFAILATQVYASPADFVGMPAPDFALRSTDGNNLRLSEYRSEVVVLNFYSSWCGKCRNTMAALESLQQEYGDADLHVLGVSIDGKADRAAETIAELGLSYPLLVDSRQVVSKAYELSRLPATLLIDREGTVRFFHKGFNDDSARHLAADVAMLLAE